MVLIVCCYFLSRLRGACVIAVVVFAGREACRRVATSMGKWPCVAGCTREDFLRTRLAFHRIFVFLLGIFRLYVV
jgi:hypothetical protein